MLFQISVLLIRISGALIYKNYALLFESFHILTDLLVTVAVYAGVRLSNSKYSRKYSYGLFRVEDLISLAIALIIAFTAIDLLLSVPSVDVGSNLLSGEIQLISVVPLLLSGIVKIIGGRAVNSPSLVSDGYHNYSDVYVGLGVGSGLLISYATRDEFFYYIAIIIAAIGIMYTAFEIGKNSVTSIMDLPKDKNVIPKIEKILRQNNEVTGVKSIKARWAGPVIFVEIVITVNSKLTIEEAHDVSDSLENKVLSEIAEIKDVVIHIEPSKSQERVVMVPVSANGGISPNTSKSLNYLLITMKDDTRISSKTVQIDPGDISKEKNALRVILLAKENQVTDAIVLEVGEILLSLMAVNHIDVWKADSDSVDENVKLLAENRLSRIVAET